MALSAIILLILLGMVLLVLEILVIPGLIAGIVGFILLLGGMIASFHYYGPQVGIITTVSSIALTILFIVLSLRSRTWKKMSLTTEIDGRVNLIDEVSITPGTKGETISRLAPSGKAMVADQIVEVHSVEGFIDEGEHIEVVKVESYKIFVRLIDKNK